MKFSFNIDIALLITIFTTFLFWCGYWYSYGYAEFFGVSISFFDLTVSTTIIDGLLVGADKLLTFLVIIFGFLFITTYSRKDFEFLLGLLGSVFAFIFITLRYKFFKEKIFRFKLAPQQSQLPLFPEFRKKQKKKNAFTKSKSVAFGKMYLQKNKMTIKQITHDIYGENQPNHSDKTFFNILAFYFLILIFTGLLYFIFYVGWTLQEDGKQTAQKYHDASFQFNDEENKKIVVFPSFIEKGQDKPSTYKLTNVCNKTSCFVVDAERNVKLVEIKDIVIQNGPIKKAP